jgi:hypothetical protein
MATNTTRADRDWRYDRRGLTETKPFFLTSEFLVFAAASIALFITAISSDSIDARAFWVFETALAAFYMVARGLAKSGTKSRSYDPREHLMDDPDRTSTRRESGTRAGV